MGRMIPLKYYAVAHGRDPATVRQKALRGGFKTAERTGRDWMIDEDEPYEDLRRGLKLEESNNSITTL